MSEYKEILSEIRRIDRTLRQKRLKAALMNLAGLKKKSNFIKTLESELETELATHKRSTRIDSILEILEDEIVGYKF